MELFTFALIPSRRTILLETAFWTSFLLAFLQLVPKVCRNMLRRRRVWYTAQKHGGLFFKNAQDDLPVLLTTGIHHTAGGALMAIGIYRSKPSLWLHGFLIETGYEIADLIAMVFGLAHFSGNGMKDEVKVPIACHHISGIIVGSNLFESGLYANAHLQNVGMWLMLVGGSSLFILSYIHTLDFDNSATKNAIAQTGSLGLFLFARFWIFPMELYHLVQDMRASEEYSRTLLSFAYGYFTLMTVFNMGMLGEGCSRTIRSIKRAFDGETAIDIDPVPPPMEGPMKKRKPSMVRILVDSNDKGDRRRSSVVQAVQMWD